MSESIEIEELRRLYSPATSILEEAESDFKHAWETVRKMKYNIERGDSCDIAKTYIGYNLGDVTFMEKLVMFLEYKLPSYKRILENESYAKSFMYHAASSSSPVSIPEVFVEIIKDIEDNIILGLETAIEMGTPMKAFYTLNLKDFKRGLKKLKEINDERRNLKK